MSDTVGHTGSADTTAVVTRLRDAHATRAEAREAVADVGRDRLDSLQDALDETVRLFDRYEDDATGTGDFQAYLSFQDDLVEFVEGLPEDLPEREVFEQWLDDFKKRQLSTRDFDRARDQLGDAHDLVERLDTLADAESEYRSALSAAKDERDRLADRITHLERVRDLGEADLDAPVSDLRDPIETYNEAITDAFEELRRESSAREVFAFLERAQLYPLVDVDTPPDDVKRYVEHNEVGMESVSRLLELADFSRSKLEHFVDQPGTFKRVIGGNRTYLDSLSAEPLTLDWPPAEAAVVRRHVDERISLAGRIAGDTAVVALREVQRIAREDRFSVLRTTAIARDELTDDDRARLRSGEVESGLEAARRQRDQILEALDEYA